MPEVTVLLQASGIIQLTFGVLLGWPLALFHTGLSKVGPFKSSKRVLQSHIDNMLMGIIQIALATIAPPEAALATVLIVIGAWVNPQIFLTQACLAGPAQLSPAIKVVSTMSFFVVTAGFLLFLPAALTAILGHSA